MSLSGLYRTDPLLITPEDTTSNVGVTDMPTRLQAKRQALWCDSSTSMLGEPSAFSVGGRVWKRRNLMLLPAEGSTGVIEVPDDDVQRF